MSFHVVHELLRKLERDPSDRDTLVVLCDWCEEKGFTDAATSLRCEGTSIEGLRTLAGLRLLFGDNVQDENVFARYNACCGFRPVEIVPSEVETIRIRAELLYKLRKVVLLTDPHNLVLSVRVGIREAFIGMGPVPALLFGLHAPEIFSSTVMIGQDVILEVQNVTERTQLVSGCVLGDLPDIPGYSGVLTGSGP